MTLEHFRVGSIVDGKLRLERLIAAGGGGAVFEASHVGLRTRVAVKVLKGGPYGSEKRLHRFLREARIAAKLKSEHAVRILDIATPKQGTPYLVMEYLQGETLCEMLQRCGAVPIPDAVDYVLQAIQPLAEMHSAGIVHRDVKPANLFLAKMQDGSTSLKLLDFGVATPDPSTEAELSLTITDAEIGTPLYMAPEQFTAAKYVDPRVDVWSLGVTLYQLIAGRTPFTAFTIAGLRTRILDEEPERIDRVRPEVPPALADVVMRCLEKDPAERIADMVTLAEALVPFAGRPPPVLHLTPAIESGPAASTESTLQDEPETLDGASQHATPLPHIVSRGESLVPELPTRARMMRLAIVPTIAATLLWIVAAAGRSGAEPEEPTAAIAIRESLVKTVEEENDERAEVPVRDVLELPVVAQAPPLVAPPSREERARPLPMRRVPAAIPTKSRAQHVVHVAPRPPAPKPEQDPIDDRIE